MKIQLNAMPFSPSGYGELTRYYMRVLRDMGHDVKVHQPWEHCDAASPQMFGRDWCEAIEDLTGRHRYPDLSIDFGFLQMMKPRWVDPTDPTNLKQSRRIGLTMFETDPLPRAYVDACNLMDAVIVPGAWGKDMFECSGVTAPVHVVPPGLYELPPVAEKHHADDPFRFLAVFTWQETRKNPLALLTAFLLEFDRSEHVELLLRTSAVARSLINELKERLGKSAYPIVRVESEVLSFDMINALYSHSSCVVSASCAEGFCMPLLEAQARGLPVITTNYSEPTSFVTEETGYLVDWRPAEALGMKKYMPDKPGYYNSSMYWAEIIVDELRVAMRSAFEHQSVAEAKGVAGRRNVIENFSRKAAVRALDTVFKELGL